MLSIRQTAYFHQPDGQIQSRHNPHELLYPPATQLTSTPTSTDSMLAHGETVTQCSAHNPQPPLLAVARGVERHHESTFLKTSARRSPPLNLNIFGREATLKGNKLSFLESLRAQICCPVETASTFMSHQTSPKFLRLFAAAVLSLVVAILHIQLLPTCTKPSLGCNSYTLYDFNQPTNTYFACNCNSGQPFKLFCTCFS